MNLETTNASVIRAIKQRELFNAWMRLYSRDNQPPAFDEYKPERLSDEMQDIMICSVDTSTDQPRIVIERDCKSMHPAFGQSGAGQNLADYLGHPHAQQFMPRYFCCIREQLPVYTIDRIKDREGRVVDYERLLLPFASEGRVTHIMASLKAISEDGHFDVLNMMRGTGATVPVIASLIAHDLAPRARERASAGDIEFR